MAPNSFVLYLFQFDLCTVISNQISFNQMDNFPSQQSVFFLPTFLDFHERNKSECDLFWNHKKQNMHIIADMMYVCYAVVNDTANGEIYVFDYIECECVGVSHNHCFGCANRCRPFE